MLGDNIRNFRKSNNLSQDELADKLNVTRQSISLWETGQTQPTIENIIALAKIFNISTDMLLNAESAESVHGIPQDFSDDNVEKHNPGFFTKNKKLLLSIIISVVSVILIIVLITVLTKKSTSSASQSNSAEITSAPPEESEIEESNAVDTSSEATVAEESTTNTEDVQVTAEPQPKATAVPQPKATAVPASEPKVDLYEALKSFVVNNGTLNGDYCYYSNYASVYGGSYDDDFALYYWGDTDTVEFSLHSVLDDTYSICYYLRVPKTFNGEYEYISSYYYRSDGASVLEAKGTISASDFTTNYPLRSTKYIGSSDLQNQFMETSRLGICSLIKCLKNFMSIENTGCSFSDFGFKNF